MQGIFNLDSPVMRVLTAIVDLVILDLLWFVTSLPIFTIGASTSAMHYMCFKILKNEEGPIFKSYFKAFKDNFKKGTIIWLVVLVVGVFLVFDLQAITSLTDSGSVVNIIMFVVFFLIALMWALIAIYVFPLQSRFENTSKKTILNALLMGISHPGKTIFMVLVDAGLLLIALWYVPVIVPVGPVLFNCLVLGPVFTKHLARSEAEAEEALPEETRNAEEAPAEEEQADN